MNIIMEKRKLTLLTALALTLGAGAQTTYFQTDFEEGMPEGMTFYDVDQNEPSTDMKALGFAVGTPWIVSTPQGEDGNHVATSTSWYRKGATSNDWMILPAVTVSDAKARLRWRSRASDKDYRDGFVVLVATQSQHTQQKAETRTQQEAETRTLEAAEAQEETDGVQTGDFDMETPLFAVGKEEYTWQEHEVDLSAYVGQAIYIAFVNNSKDRTMLYVDDIFVGIPSTVGLQLDMDHCFDRYGNVQISGHALATGHETITSFTVGFELEGQTVSQTFGGVSIAPGQQMAFTIDEPLNIERNRQYHYNAWIASGDDRSDVSGRFWAIPWKLVCEEVTGTWCQFCVRGIGAMNQMRETAPDGFIGIAIHNDNPASNVPDSMAIEGEKYLEWVMKEYGMGGFPNCVMNRSSMYQIDPGNIPYYYDNIRAYDKYEAGIEAHASYDGATGQVSVATDVLFTKDYDEANFRLFYVVIENRVHRTHAETGIMNDYCGYDQINAYAGGAQGKCYGFEDLPGILNADDMWYNDVARGTWPTDDFRGLKDIMPRRISEGDICSHECTFPLPAKILNIENCEVVVMLLDKDGRYMNADVTPIGIAGHDGISQLTDEALTADRRCYDLQGRKAGRVLKRGLYVRDGRKFFVR